MHVGQQFAVVLWIPTSVVAKAGGCCQVSFNDGELRQVVCKQDWGWIPITWWEKTMKPKRRRREKIVAASRTNEDRFTLT